MQVESTTASATCSLSRTALRAFGRSRSATAPCSKTSSETSRSLIPTTTIATVAVSSFLSADSLRESLSQTRRALRTRLGIGVRDVEREHLQLDREVDLAQQHVMGHGEDRGRKVQDRADAGREEP